MVTSKLLPQKDLFLYFRIAMYLRTKVFDVGAMTPLMGGRGTVGEGWEFC